MPRTRRSTPDKIAAAATAFPMSAADLKTILDRDVLKGSYVCPGPNALKILAFAVNHVAEIVEYQAREGGPFVQKLWDFWRSVMTMTPLAFELRDEISARFTESVENDEMVKYYTALSALQKITEGLWMIRDAPLLRPASNYRQEMSNLTTVTSWPVLAPVLYKLFVDAMATTKSPKIGLSNTGPGARFVTTMIPLMYGTQPTLAAVGIELRRAAKREVWMVT